MSGRWLRICNLAWLAIGVITALCLAESQGVRADSNACAAWQSPWARRIDWLPYSEGLPTYAMVLTVAAQPTSPIIVYAGTYEPPGLWRSDDGGQSWVLDDRGLEGSPVYSLHWDEVRQRWWVSARDGLYSRSGADRPWQSAKLESQPVYAVAEDAMGWLYAAAEDGLFRSRDGEAWTRVPIAGPAGGMTTLDLDVSPEGRALLIGTAGQGLWVSRDGGASWLAGEMALSTPQSGGKGSLDVSAEQPAGSYIPAVLLSRSGGVAFAGTSESAYRSSDGGATWMPVDALEGRVCGFAAGSQGEVYAALTGRVARSTDGGVRWEQFEAGLPADDKVLDLAVSPEDPSRLYAAAWEGLYGSTDGGQSWQPLHGSLGYPDVNVLAWDSEGNLLAGTRSGIYRRGVDQPGWKPVPDGVERSVLTFTDAGNGRDLYAGLSGGFARSADGGRTWSEVMSELSEQGIAGLVVDSSDLDHLLAWVAFGRVHESTDGGRTWTARWEGLGTVRPVTSIHQSAAGQLFVGAEDGLFRWEPARGEWQPLTLPLVAPAVFALESDRHDPRVVYVGATDGLWRSFDGGSTWNRWGKGMEGLTVTALAFSPADRRIAFAGTRHMGLYITTDGGATWQPAWEDRLAAASVRDILFSRDGATVFVASDRGIWRGEPNGAR